jgi:hypothetical protein
VATGCADGDSGGAEAAAPRSNHVARGPQGRVGQFVVECAWSHSSFDDPIVHPGHAGASHRHDFFGSTSTSADSAYAELVGGDTSCEQRLDTSAYWAPSLLDADGRPLSPVRAVAYYRAGEGVDPGTIEAYPAGLMMVAGDAASTEPQALDVVAWACGAGGQPSTSPPACAAEGGLRLVVTFPDCWDGERVDSADHRAHVAYSDSGRCGDTHPVAIPQLQFAIEYGPIEPDGLSLASGPLTSAHADFWNAWDQAKLETEVDLCIRREVVCGVSD